MNPPRSAVIKQRLDEHFIGNGARVSTPEPTWWWNNAHGLGSLAVLGWTFPVPNEPDGVVVPFCPEVIDAQTTEMTHEELDVYLGVIEWVVDTHIASWSGWADSEDRQALIDAELSERYPDSHLLLHHMIERVYAARNAPTTDFDDIIAGIEIEEPEGLLRVSELDNLELVRRNEKVRQELLASGEMNKDNPTTQEARDLHSQRVALLVEMKRRGLR